MNATYTSNEAKTKLSGLEIRIVNDAKVKYKNIQILDSVFDHSYIENLELDNIKFHNTSMQQATFRMCNVENSEFTSINLTSSIFENVIFRDSTFIDVDFYDSQFTKVMFLNCTFRDCNFQTTALDTDVTCANCSFKGLSRLTDTNL